MTDKEIQRLFKRTGEFDSPNSFAASEPEIDREALCELWEIANAPFKELLDMIGLTQVGCSTRFCVPFRTVQGWALGERNPPPYVRLMMAELSLHLKIRDN